MTANVDTIYTPELSIRYALPVPWIQPCMKWRSSQTILS